MRPWVLSKSERLGRPCVPFAAQFTGNFAQGWANLCKMAFRLISLRFSALLLLPLCFALAGNPRMRAQAKSAPAPQASAAKTSALPSAEDAKRAKVAYGRGKKHERAHEFEMAFADYTQAVRLNPGNRDYLLARETARGILVGEHVDRAENDLLAGNDSEARHELHAALALDPGDEMVRERLAQIPSPEMQQLAQLLKEPSGEVHLQPLPGMRNLEFRGDTASAYDYVARQFGVHASFDADLQRNAVHLQLSAVNFPTAMRVLGDMTGTFWRPLTQTLFFVAADTPQKRLAYDASVVRAVELPDSASNQEMTQDLRVLRAVTGINRAELNFATHTITMRASPQAISVAARLLQQLQKRRGEVVLEMEVLEVDRNAATALGITPPAKAQAFTLTPQQIQEAQQGAAGLVSVIQQLFGSAGNLTGLSSTQLSSLVGSGAVGVGSLIPPILAFGGGRTTFFATMPGAALAFSDMLNTVRAGRRVLLRAQDGKPATFFVGDRIPVALAQFSPSLTSPAFIPAVSSDLFPESTIATGNDPVAVAGIDFNGDDKFDLAVVNHGDNSVSILLGNGDGTFNTSGTLATGQGPIAAVAADFNGDGIADLAVLNQTDATVDIFQGNGDGTFTPQGTLPVGKNPVAMVSGDFNGDGHLDLAVVNQGDNTISILAGNGDETFQPQTTFGTGSQPSAIAAADFNNDGRTDLVVTNQADNTASIFLGKGDGTFSSGATLTTGTAPVAIAAGQFNLSKNTNVGLAVVNQTDNTISVFLGNGDGTFRQAATVALNSSSTTGNKPAAITSGDFNLDGLTDLAVTDQSANTVSILIGNGDGSFASPLNLPAGTAPAGLVSGEFLGTSHPPDLAIANTTVNQLTIILDNATFNATGTNSVASTPFPSAEYEDVGLKIEATPYVQANNDVTLNLRFELRSLTGSTINGIPVISNQTVEQTVRAKSGETTALAGILQNQEMRAISGTPGAQALGPLALAGSALHKQNSNTELLILLTPHIVQEGPRTGQPIYAGSGAGGSAGAGARSVP